MSFDKFMRGSCSQIVESPSKYLKMPGSNTKNPPFIQELSSFGFSLKPSTKNLYLEKVIQIVQEFEQRFSSQSIAFFMMF